MMFLNSICRLKLTRGGLLSMIRHNSNANRENAIKSLRKYLKVTESKAHYLCLKHPYIDKLDETKIKDITDCLYNLGFQKEVLINKPQLFLLLPVTFRFRYRVLKECGFSKIEPVHIVSYLSILKQKTIGELKENGVIQPYINIENRLASYMTQWPTSLTNVIYGDVNACTFYSLRLKIIQRYLELILDLTEDEFNRALKTYPTIKHRPLEAINETLKILQSQIMMSPNKIKSNLYLIHADPDNLRDIIVSFRSIGGIDIKEVIRMHPRIATKSCSILFEIRNVLQEHGIANEAQRRCFDIYTLGPKTVRERLEHAKSIPEFSTYVNHPRFLKMIHYNKTAMKRLRELYDNNKKCLSLNILSGSSAHFEVFEKAPGDRLGKGKDLLFCISQLLGKEYRANNLRKILKRHPYWINIPLVQVKLVFEKLSEHFTSKDIYENCPVMLYPWSKIKDTMEILNTHSSSLPDHLDMTKLSQSQKLSLVLYLLERSHYFSGNGVWGDEKSKGNSDVQHLQELKNVYSVQAV